MILKRQSGGAAVEFAVLLPFLVSLAFGIIEVGLLLYNQQVITNASREGARAAIQGSCAGGSGPIFRKTDEQIKQIVIDYCAGRLITFAAPQPSDLNPTVTPSLDGCTPGGSGLTIGDDVTVTVTYKYTFLLPSLIGFSPNSDRQLNARTVMKMMSKP